ncbi:hypothetical protein KFE25_013802 [Diacronema lutheri]|uniref:Cyclin N-terminal domain-containing protein n=1 Tax=Diacronema lutheri TaxID=2081491 RepID=A0A8J5XQX6_DIALT|nr:hypothetical protein KFE25_013802 [Diacronema lutheri]
MLGFAQTSHGRKWTYAPDNLDELRRASNARGAAHVSAGPQLEGEPVEPLSPEEELALLRKFATHDLPLICAAERVRASARARERIRALACVFLVRVYAARSMMEVCGGGVLDPRVVLCTCVLVAAKVEEAKEVDAAALEAASQVSRALILAVEPDVLAALDHDLCAHSPIGALDGLLHALAEDGGGVQYVKAEPGAPPAETASVQRAHAHARLRAACVGLALGAGARADGLLRYSPQQLALAAFGACAHTPDGTALGVAPFLSRRLPGLLVEGAGADERLAPVRAAMRDAAAAHGVDEEAEAARADALYHRLKICHQRAKAASAALAAERAAAGAKRRLDAVEARPAPADVDDASAPLAKVRRSSV